MINVTQSLDALSALNAQNEARLRETKRELDALSRVIRGSGSSWIIRDDDKANGRTFVKGWRIVAFEVEADWTRERSEACVFDHRDVARLVSVQVGGMVKKVRP